MNIDRWKVIPISLGIGCLAVTLLGARNFFPDEVTKTEPLPQKTTGPTGLGPVVPGVVDSEVEVGYYFAPDVLPVARVKRVLVKEGQSVTVGSPLVEFDDSQLQSKKKVAEAGVKIAEVKVSQAKLQFDILPLKKEEQRLAVKKVLNDQQTTERTYQLANDKIETYIANGKELTKVPYTTAEKDSIRKNNIEYQAAIGFMESTKLALEKEELVLKNLDKLNPQFAVDEAQAEVDRLKAVVNEIQMTIDACTLKSSINGTIARVTIGPGAIVGPATTKPTVIVVPTGKRLVRAEVVPEFAHKIAGSIGRAVIIYDNDNFNLKYEGEVVGVGEAFLPPRFASQDVMRLNANRVLECTILVKDPSPSGQPSLRVGQPVRVSFP